MNRWPTVKYKEEGMREGMQIEDANISVDDKVELLDALSETGLQQIVVGSFVSPKWTPGLMWYIIQCKTWVKFKCKSTLTPSKVNRHRDFGGLWPNASGLSGRASY